MSWIIGVMLFSLSAFAEQIHHIDEGKGQEPTLLFLTDGRVVRVKSDDATVRHFKEDLAQKTMMSAQFDEGEVRIEEDGEMSVMKPEKMRTAYRNFKGRISKHSQCYDRAHVWAYEAQKYQQVNLGKMFLFFTSSYIRKYNYHWWFHVAPYGKISEGAEIVERVLDAKFFQNPPIVRAWTNYFMQDDAECPAITAYSQYKLNQETQSCYLYRASLFYLQPLDLEALEKEGKQKTGWIDWEVQNAYSQGFRRGRWW